MISAQRRYRIPVAGFGDIPWPDFAVLSLAFFLALHNFQASLWEVNREADFYAATAGKGSAARQVGYVLLLLYGLCGTFLARRFRLKPLTAVAFLVYGLLFWIYASGMWSTNLSTTAARLFGFTSLCLALVGSAKRLTKAQIILWFALSTWVYALIGFCTELLLGTFKPWSAEYRFAGTLHPNEQGINCFLMVLAALWLVIYKPNRRLFRWMLYSSIPFLLLTKSRTSVLSVLLGALLYYGFLRFTKMKLALFVTTLLLVGMVPAALESYNISLGSALQMGRDKNTSDNESLTGRVPLWQILWTEAEKRPMIGYGYGAFWTAERIVDISADQGWGISAAHSAYLDAILSVGFVGLALYLALIFAALRQSILLHRYFDSNTPVFFGLVFTVSLINGVADSEPWIVSSLLLFAVMHGFLAVFFKPTLRTPSEL